MSRTIKFAKPGGPEVVEFIEMEMLVPGPHEVSHREHLSSDEQKQTSVERHS